uniref:Succinate dehydrogenase cytochrome b560 subunit n=1 Tax=Pseudodiaptomus poplesia TaxID=213370 RepID=A0A0U2UP58_9MAXI|nr:succinate dehydrogenase cytochrome b560 subunit [Pseudodiaptomus poplesia]
MSLCVRLASRSLCRAKWSGASLVPARAMATMKPMSAEEHKISRTEFWTKNKNLGRPISPHILIYKFEMPALMSITHRATGLFQSALLTGSAIGVMTMSGTFPALLGSIQAAQFGAPLIFLAKFALAWPFSYHLLNGIRHLSWDMGYGFKMQDLYKTGWSVLAVSVLLTLGIVAI